MVRIAIHVFGLIKTLPSQPSTPPSTSFLATICGGVGTSNVNSTPTGKDGGQPQDHCSGLARRFCMTITQRVGMRKIELVDFCTQNDIGIHHLTQLHEKMPLIKLLRCTLYEIPNLL